MDSIMSTEVCKSRKSSPPDFSDMLIPDTSSLLRSNNGRIIILHCPPDKPKFRTRIKNFFIRCFKRKNNIPY